MQRHCERQRSNPSRRTSEGWIASSLAPLAMTVIPRACEGYPVRRGHSVLSPTPRNTGSSAFADDDDRAFGARSVATSYTFSFSRRDAPELCQKSFALISRGRGECRVPNAPAAWCALLVVSMHTSIHSGGTGIIRHSPRNGFNGFLRALPGDEFLFATVASRIEWLHVPGWADKTSARLSISNGCQDHTTSPYATMPLVSRASDRSRISSPCDHLKAHTTPSRPPHPALHVRDDRDTPLFGRGGTAREVPQISEKQKLFIFARTSGQ
jgi:hypothetical protein